MRTFKVCDEALQQAGMTVRDLDGVILVGGPTRLPTIRTRSSSTFGCSPQPTSTRTKSSLSAPPSTPHRWPRTRRHLPARRHAALPALGIAGGLTEPIIERNSPVPIDVSRLFNPVRDNQETVTVRIYQGEARSAEDNELLGQFEFSGYEPGPREEVQIEVTFEISTEGIVKVAAADPKTGVAHSTTVSMSSGLSEAEIEAIIARGRAEEAERDSKGGGRSSSREAVADFVAQNRESVDLPQEDDLLLDLPDLSADLPDAPDEDNREQFGDAGEHLSGPDEDPA